MGPDPDLGPPSNSTVQKKNRKVTKCQRAWFQMYLIIPAEKERGYQGMLLQHGTVSNRQGASDTGDPRVDDVVQGPYVPVVGELSLLTPVALCQIRLCGFVPYLLSSPL